MFNCSPKAEETSEEPQIRLRPRRKIDCPIQLFSGTVYPIRIVAEEGEIPEQQPVLPQHVRPRMGRVVLCQYRFKYGIYRFPRSSGHPA